MEEFSADLDATLRKCIEKEILLLNNVGFDLESSRNLMNFDLPKEIESYKFCGIHPHSAQEYDDKDILGIEELLDSKVFSGIGEIGIDRYWYKKEIEIEKQKELFRKQMDIAVRKKMPVMLHIRDAYDEAMEVAEEYKGLTIEFHSFLGEEKHLKKIISNGWYFGVNGVLTFKNSTVRNVVKKEYFDRMLIETDAPYLAPVPHRGKRNSPLFVTDIYDYISNFYNIEMDELKERVYNNFKRFAAGEKGK